MKLIAALLAAVPFAAMGGSSPAEPKLPIRAQDQWQELKKDVGLEVSTRLGRYFYGGEFDGDRARDLAVLVKRKSDGKEGIAVFWGNGVKPTILGAGAAFGNGGDDFSWIDAWALERRGHQWGPYAKPWGPAHEGIAVFKNGSGGALIYFADGEAKWLDRGI